MSKWLLIRRLLAGRPLQNSIAVLVMAFSVALAVCVLLVSSGLHDGLVQAAKPFPMLMGAKGSPNQLVLNSVFLKDQPVGNFSYDEVVKLRGNKNVSQAIPLGFGDNYRGFRLVGSEPEIFSFKGIGAGSGPWLHVGQGKIFSGKGQAVIGSEVARLTGLKIGDRFVSVHGMISTKSSRAHKEQYTVVGILDKVHGPYDSAIFVSMESIWEQHKQQQKGHEKEVTAVVIRPNSYGGAMQLAASYGKNRDVQVIFPSKTVIQLFSILGNVEKLLQFLSMAVLVLALLIIGSSLYWFVLGSQRQQAVMRALGATVKQVTHLYFCLGMTLVGSGLVLGLVGGQGLYALLAYVLRQYAGLVLGFGFLPAEGILALAVIICGALCSYIPARMWGRHDIADSL